MKRDEIVSALLSDGNKMDKAHLYADALMEWLEARANIDEHGAIVFHPRTGAPIENPYLSVRTKAAKKLQDIKGVKAEKLWQVINSTT